MDNETQIQVNSLSCDQVYQIWSTEPELLRIIDMRPAALFAKAHIPGSVWCREEDLNQELAMSQDRLAVIVSGGEASASLVELSRTRTNVVLLSQCSRWIGGLYPLVGSGLNQIQRELKENFKKSKGADVNDNIIFQQLFEPQSSTYTYIIADRKTREAAIIDPVLETVERDYQLLQDLNLRLMYILDTHIHADHITGAAKLKELTGAKTGVSQKAKVQTADIQLEDGQILRLGDHKIQVLATPGHTDTCLSFHFYDRVFTGDALLIRGSGRTDFQQGSAETLYQSVTQKIFQLPEETLVYPGHDYRGLTSSTVALEKQHNPRLGGGRSQADFVKTMQELKLPPPKRLDEAVAANLKGGQVAGRVMSPQVVDGMPEVSVHDVASHLGKVRLIDVRRPDEFNGELHHIPGAELVTLGPELEDFLKKADKSQEMVFVCRSGGRSGQATQLSRQMGFQKTANMVGGMIRWNEEKLPTEVKKDENGKGVFK